MHPDIQQSIESTQTADLSHLEQCNTRIEQQYYKHLCYCCKLTSKDTLTPADQIESCDTQTHLEDLSAYFVCVWQPSIQILWAKSPAGACSLWQKPARS